MADALVSAVSQQLTAILFQEAEYGVRLFVGIKEEEVKRLSSTLQTIRAVLVDAEKRQLKEQAVKVWLDKFQNVSYDIEDVLGEWEIAILKMKIARDQSSSTSILLSKVRSWIHSPIPCITRAIHRYDIAVKIKKLNERLQVIAKEKDDYAFTVDQSRRHDLEPERERPITTSFIDVSDIRGRDRDKNVLENARHLTLIHDEPVAIPDPIFNVKKLRSLHLNLNDSSAVSASLAKLLDQLTCLRILSFKDMNFGFKTSINAIPKEIGKLMHLRYLNLEGNSELEKLPETVCDLCNLQTLNIKSCKNLIKLPHRIGKLINLRHVQNVGTDRCRFMPKGMQRLTSLRTLEEFVVSRSDVESKSCSLGDLGNFTHLRGELEIRGLGNVAEPREAKKAGLRTKSGLRVLRLKFDSQETQRINIEDENVVFEALQPPPHLESLGILNCRGPVAFPNWMTSLSMLKRVQLQNCLNWESLPPMGKLQSLESLEIEFLNKVKKVGDEILGVERGEGQSSSSSSNNNNNNNNNIAFPVLKSLKFYYMKEWEEWEYGNLLTSTSEVIMPHLRSLTINYCLKLKALPGHLLHNTTLQELHIRGCPVLGARFEKGRGEDWPSISHIPTIQIDDELVLG
ncbi:hypothetical protein QUC31_012310 [Theobroma cacao]